MPRPSSALAPGAVRANTDRGEPWAIAGAQGPDGQAPPPIACTRCMMLQTFRETLEGLVTERIAGGEDPADLFEELAREANMVFGRYSLEYELGLMLVEAKQPEV